MVINDFQFLDDQNNTLQVALGIKTSPFPIIEKFPDGSFRQEYLKGRHRGLKWKIKEQEVIFYLNDYVIGYPSNDFNFVIAIFGFDNNKYSAPSNAVVLNGEGSIRFQLTPPELISKHALEKLNDSENKKKQGFWFENVRWNIDTKGNTVTSMWIGFNTEWFEERVLDPETGKFGECLGSGRL